MSQMSDTRDNAGSQGLLSLYAHGAASGFHGRLMRTRNAFARHFSRICLSFRPLLFVVPT